MTRVMIRSYEGGSNTGPLRPLNWAAPPAPMVLGEIPRESRSPPGFFIAHLAHPLRGMLSWSRGLIVMAGPVVCNACSAQSSCIISSLSQEKWARLEPKLRRLRWGPRETIFHQGGPVAGLHVLCQGCAKLVFRTPLGKELLIRFCRSGDLLEGVLSEEHVMSAVSVDGVAVSLIPSEVALELLKSQPELAVEVARRLSRDRRHMLLGRLAYLAYRSVRKRLARGLLELGTRYGVRCEQGLLIDLPLSRQDLAELLGISRQTVCQELQKLARRGLIGLDGRRIILADPEALRGLR